MPGFQTLYFQIPQATISGLISRIPGIRIPLQGGRISSKRDLPSNFTACLRHLPSSHSLNPHYPIRRASRGSTTEVFLVKIMIQVIVTPTSKARSLFR